MPIEVLIRSKTFPKIGDILGRVLIVASKLIGIKVDMDDAKGNKIVELTGVDENKILELTVAFTNDGVKETDSVAKEVTHSSVDEVLGTFFSNTWS